MLPTTGLACGIFSCGCALLIMRNKILALSLLVFTGVNATEYVWQPVIHYALSLPNNGSDAGPEINPFENFTHFASDFGWMGPGQSRIETGDQGIRIQSGEEWTGAWHSLAGLARESQRSLDPLNIVGLDIDGRVRAEIREVVLKATGRGRIRLELGSDDQGVVWHAAIDLQEDTDKDYSFPVNSSSLGKIKMVNWIAEPGCDATLYALGFQVARPAITAEEWLFRISLGKLRRCHDPASGLTRDRGHLPAGEFDSIPATGLHALASALAVKEGLLDLDLVVSEIQQTIKTLETLPKAAGFLPHFVRRGREGAFSVHPGTEFSTVDTSIALHGLLLATEILNLQKLSKKVGGLVDALDFDRVTDANGWISHGFQEDGKTSLAGNWKDWGGETALVLALEAMVLDRENCGLMDTHGHVFRGVGFIGEIQSLLYPDFDKPIPDKISGVVWPEVRSKLLDRQRNYFQRTWPESGAARSGLFGLSAGERGMPGSGYAANGVEVPGARWLHPHYFVMGLALSGGDSYRDSLRKMEAAGFLFPMGLPENIEADLKLHNPMQGSINAAFETLAAYHGWCGNDRTNLVYLASMNNPLTRQAAYRFYD